MRERKTRDSLLLNLPIRDRSNALRDSWQDHDRIVHAENGRQVGRENARETEEHRRGVGGRTEEATTVKCKKEIIGIDSKGGDIVSLEKNKAIVRRWIEEVNKRNLAILDELVAPDFFHSTFQLRGPEGIKLKISPHSMITTLYC